MKAIRPAFALLSVLVVQCLCWGGQPSTPTKPPPEKIETSSQSPTSPPVSLERSVGKINPISPQVQSGPIGNLKSIEESQDFHDGDGVSVTKGGKGQLLLDDGAQMTLFGEIEISGVTVRTSPPENDLLLQNQGFLGYVPEGDKATINLPNGAQVSILGTQFFVLYSNESKYATAGNFDGTVFFNPMATSQQSLQPGTMVDIAPDGSFIVLQLPFKPEEFENAADKYGTPIDGLNALRNQYGIPSQAATPLPPTPRVPTLLKPVSGSDETSLQPEFGWENVENAAGFQIQLDDNSDFGSPEYNETVGVTGWTPREALKPNLVYYWHVRAISASGVPGDWSAMAYFSMPALPAPTSTFPATAQPVSTPSVPSIVNPKQGDTVNCPASSAALYWRAPYDPLGIDRYKIQLDVLLNEWAPILETEVPGYLTQTDVTKEVNSYCGHQMSWRIFARNSAGYAGTWSSWNDFYTVSISPPTITPTPLPKLVFDFVKEVPNAKWNSQVGKYEYDLVLGSPADKYGGIFYQNTYLEDHSFQKNILAAYPPYLSNYGSVEGKYYVANKLQYGDRFVAKVGYMAGCAGDTARFSLYFSNKDPELAAWLDRRDEKPDGKLSDWVFVLPKELDGQSGWFVMELYADITKCHDSLAWLEARLERP